MRVAVYVPCFNGAAWIEECVAALLAQTRRPAEVAVVDDGSTDDSAAIVRTFGERVRLIQHERNRGLAVARNTALREIECDVVKGSTRKHQVFREIQELAITRVGSDEGESSIENSDALRHEVERVAQRKLVVL